LIEIGVEELPAIPFLKELPALEKKWANILEKNALSCDFTFEYTPRRLVFMHDAFLVKQPNATEEFFGAPVAVAFKDGEATPAATGFAKKCGVRLEELGRNEKGGKEVLYYAKEVEGSLSTTLLGGMVLELLNELNFGKSMRWGNRTDAFIRPIRWLNVQLGGDVVAMEVFGVTASNETYVHRSASFEAQTTTIENFAQVLEEGGVTLNQQKRYSVIDQGFKAIEAEHGVTIEIDSDLLDEVVAITENPTPLLGTFDEAFLVLPQEVIITSMKEHQRYFPVFKDGKLSNHFIVVSNALTEDFSKVVSGNERVLRPRLSDGLFFYENDLKRGLINDGLEKVVFMDGLGSVLDKVEREQRIVKFLLDHYGDMIEGNSADVIRASEIHKADLMSDMVYEFTELQGIMGYYYAQRLGENDQVATIIKEQYLPDGEQSDLPSSNLSALLAMAVKLDSLFGLFSIGKIPTGSRDPFALRRAVVGLVRMALAYKLPFNLEIIFNGVKDQYAAFEYKTLNDFFFERIYQFYDVNPSVITAVLQSGERNLVELDQKITAVDSVVKGSDFKAIASTFKRVANITKDVDLEGNLDIFTDRFEKQEEYDLFEAFSVVNDQAYETYKAKLEALFALKPQLDSFFDGVMVNAEDETIKTNRKNLIASIYNAFKTIADIKEITA
jgi:glycyl-tRNA synthetase beta chain